jgi:hypothetical protein
MPRIPGGQRVVGVGDEAYFFAPYPTSPNLADLTFVKGETTISVDAIASGGGTPDTALVRADLIRFADLVASKL